MSASKRRAIEFIALNDNNGDEDERLDADAIATYISVQVVAAAWDQEPSAIAEAVVRKRRQLD